MTTIKLHNSKTRKKEEFKPLDENNVRMYVCGPTVYDRAHLGNARPVVVFDTLFRLLRHVYGDDHVTYARNFTDVDDKINAKAAETGRSIRDITDETIGWYLDDMGALGALEPSVAPRATEYIPQMVDMIGELIEKGHAYAAEGHVLFAVDSWKEHYGKLSGRSVDDMIAGARVEVAPYKRNPMDFVLWKPSDGETPGWESPWGYGRPGWHIECSAMARELFGEKFDIHGGGLDLQFPHHENEIAQSCACCGTDSFAQYWMHNEMLQVEGKKMSKSLGNFFTVRDLLDQGYSGEVIRFVMLSTHYSKPMDWTDKKAKEAEATLKKWRKLTDGVDAGSLNTSTLDAISDDLNTPLAITGFHALAKQASENEQAAGELKASAQLLGLLTSELSHSISSYGYDHVLGELIELRAASKAAKDFSKADEIRDFLIGLGFEITDDADGTRVEMSNFTLIGYSSSADLEGEVRVTLMEEGDPTFDRAVEKLKSLMSEKLESLL